MLDRTSPVPLYHQLACRLEAEIATGDFAADHPFYSDRELVSRYGVSLLTARQAMGELERKRLIRRRQGKGTFLTAQAAELGRQQATKTGVILFTGWAPAALSSWESMYFHDIFKGIQAAADELGWRVVFDDGEPGRGLDLGLEMEAHRLIGAIALIGGRSDERVAELCQLGLKAVTVNFLHDGVPSVMPDDYRGGCLATEHLLACGCRRLAHLNSGEAARHWQEVARAYRDVIQAAGLALAEHPVVNSRLGCGSLEAGYEAARALWTEHGPVDGIFAGNDLMPLGIMRYLGEVGVRVPADVSLVGFDNIDVAAIASPPLTTVAVDRRGLGRRAVELLSAGVPAAGEPPAREVLPVCLEVRSSTRNSVPAELTGEETRQCTGAPSC